MASYNLRNPAVKRLMREADELQHPTEEYFAQPIEDNLFEWHFTLQGPPGTDFENGIYHGRITLPPDYPMKPPSIILLTPNGRFEVNKKICLSISGHHPETWQPSWSIRTALLAIIGFLPTHANGALGSLDYTPKERKELALKSQTWKCSLCGCIKNLLKQNTSPDLQESPVQKNEDELSGQQELFESVHLEDPVEFGSNGVRCRTQQSTQNTVTLNETLSQMSSTSYESQTNVTVPVEKQSQISDYFLSMCMWVIAIMLGILIIRRIFCYELS